MSSPKHDGSKNKENKKRNSIDALHAGHGSESVGASSISTSSPKLSSKPSNVGMALKLTPSTTIDALMYWNECLDRAVENDPAFTSLDLEGQSYPADFVSSLAEGIKTNNHLVYINLSRHQTGNTGVKALCLGLRGNTTIKKLALSHTGIGVVAGQSLCDLLIVSKSLTHLVLSGNPLLADCCGRFAEVMKSNKHLKHLDVSECNFLAAPWREALRWNCTLQELVASISIPSEYEITYGASSAGRAMSATVNASKSGSKSAISTAQSLSAPGFHFTSAPAVGNSGPDRFVQPLTNEPNSECQLMVKTNRIVATLSTFMDENHGVGEFVSYLRRNHPTILIDSCRRGHQAAVHRLLEIGVDPNESFIAPVKPPTPRKTAEPPSAQQSPPSTPDPHSLPLQEAIIHGNMHIIKLLISYGAQVMDEMLASLPSNVASGGKGLNSSGSNTPLSRSQAVSGSSSGPSLSREILAILRNGQNGIVDLSNGTYQLFGPTSLVPRPGILGLKLNNNSLGPNFPTALMAALLSIGSELTSLNLKGNAFISIPSQIGDLLNLTSLSLNDNQLETIPASLGQLEHLKELKIRKNPISLLPEDIVKKGTARILQYLKEITVPVHPWPRIKLLVVGRENVGKTHLIRRLQKRDYSQNMSTDGLEISDVPATKKVDFCIFDFGGQQVFYPTHMFFLSERALFTVVFSALDDESFRTVEYWLKVIRALASGGSSTPVVLVATHMDDPMAANAIPDLKDRIKKLRQNYRTLIREVIYISNTTGEGHKELKHTLVDLALHHKILTTPVPESYVLMDKLIGKEKAHKRPLLMWNEYRAIAKNAHIYDDSTLKACTQFMHDVGTIIWFNQPELSNLVILDPQWLSDVMASVISFKANWKSGLLQHDSLAIVWKQYPASLHKTLLGILERFEIVFPIRGAEGASIVPTMLPNACSEFMETFGALQLPASSFRRIERTYRFGFMPIGFFSRLMARLFLIPNLFCHDPWLRGVVISSPSVFENADEHFEQFMAETAEAESSTNPDQPLSELLHRFILRTAAIRRGSIKIGEAEYARIVQQYATLNALKRGFEQASVSYFESPHASILNIIIWRPYGPECPPSDNLLTYIVDTVEELLSTNYKKYDDSIDRIMVLTSPSNQSIVSEFPLPDLIQRISSGETFVECRGEQVNLEELAPDICFTDVPRFNDVVIQQELGEGGSGLVFLATVPTADLEHEVDQFFIRTPSVMSFNSLRGERSPSIDLITAPGAESTGINPANTLTTSDGSQSEPSSSPTPFTGLNSLQSSEHQTIQQKDVQSNATPMEPIHEEPEAEASPSVSLVTTSPIQCESGTLQKPIPSAAIEIQLSSNGQRSEISPSVSPSNQTPVPCLRRSKKKNSRLLVGSGPSRSQEDTPILDSSGQTDNLDDHRSSRQSIDSISPGSVSPASVQLNPMESGSLELSKSTGSNDSPTIGSLLSLQTQAHRDIQLAEALGISSNNATTAAAVNGRTLIALKRLKVTAGMEVQRFREFAHEVRLMASLNHPCVVRLYGVQLAPLGMLMEYISGKDLSTILHNPSITDEMFTWRIRVKLALDIARGMRYLQSQSPPIVHRDLRSPNIFVLGLDERLSVSAKVADFGLSMRVLSNFNDALQTWQWLAPEVIDMSHCNYDETSDVYSYGVVLWEIATRKFPFSEYTAYINKDRFELTEAQMADEKLLTSLQSDGWEINGKEAVLETYNRQKFVDLILKENLRPTIPSTVPPAYAKLIEMCWAREPSSRPSFHTIVAALSKMLGDKSKRATKHQSVYAAPHEQHPDSLPLTPTATKKSSSLSFSTSNIVPPKSTKKSSMEANGPLRSSSAAVVPQHDGSPDRSDVSQQTSDTANGTPERNLQSKKTNPSLLSTLSFLQKLQEDGDDHGLDDASAAVFQNLVSTPGVEEGDLESDLSPRMGPNARLGTVGRATGSRPSLFGSSSSIHSGNLNVTHSSPTSAMAPVILTRTLEDLLSQSALAMAQAEENRVWVGQQDGRISVFDTSSPPKLVTSFLAHKKEIFALAVVGQEMWAGSADGTISVWSIKKLKLKKLLKDHQAVVRCLLSVPKLGKNNPAGCVISGDTAGNLLIWKNMSLVNKFQVEAGQPINSLCYVEESKHLWVGTYRKVFIFSVQDWSLVTQIQAHDGIISAMVNTGDILWTCCSNTNTLSCWDTKTLQLKMTINGTPRITSLALVTHPIDKTTFLWAGSLEKFIYIYDCSTGELIESLKGHSDYVYTLLKLYNEQSVWSSGRDCTVRTWNF